ncbi:MAG: hypothetical protein OEY24_03590 [Candidatus Bathyarchaeota archaeon]|nr:hypothetical protein [Candidatus Bathyarchaeota archaeon]MDH5494768.1 hypothetical protein [Candidatus Bathyarchaeota archaeon]
MKSLTTRRLALLTILSTLCISIQLMPRPPNVEFTSLLVFIVGVFFGTFIGSALGTTVMFINGFLSPWGFAGLMLPFQITGMIIIGIVGGLYGRTKKGTYTLSSCGETAALGAFLTLVYDVITNFGVAVSNIVLGMPILPAFISAIVFGAPFSLIHVVSNFLVFSLAFFPLTKALQKFFGGENIWKKASLPM